MIFVIYGQEHYLMEKQLEKLKKQLNCNEQLLNFCSYDLEQTPLEVVVQDLATPGFLAENKMVVVKNPLFLTALKSKMKHDEPKIQKCLDLSDDHNHLVFYLNYDKLDERKKIVKKITQIGKIYRFAPLTHQKLSDSYRQMIAKKQATISNEALDLLLVRHSGGLLEAIANVEKLTLYTKNIGREAVAKVILKPLEENIFELQNAILKKDRAKMFGIYRDLMVLNEEPIKLIVLLGNALRLLYQVSLLDRKGYNDAEIAKMLNINRFRLKYIRENNKYHSLEQIQELLNRLSQLDYQIKTGRIDKKLGFELFLLRI